MIAGRFAFHGLSEYLTWQKVKALDYTFPDGFDEQAKALVQKLLVKSPTERLGAGELGRPNDIKALKAHPFFASIDWTSLWTVPPPTLESGLVKKEPKPANNRWNDVEYNWEHVVAFPRSHDEIPWAGEEEEEEERTEHGYVMEEETEIEGSSADVEEEPELETVYPNSQLQVAPSILPASKPIPVPAPPVQQDQFATGSTTSSSEGSPIEKLGAALDAALRGRTRNQTPIQGSGLVDPNLSDFLLLLALLQGLLIYVSSSSILLHGEEIKFKSLVSTSSQTRRPSRLLSLATKKKTKTRLLVLTNNRLICLKVGEAGRASPIRGEWALKPAVQKGGLDHDKLKPDKEKKKGKDILNQAVYEVHQKGEKEFVVLTVCQASFLGMSCNSWCARQATKSLSFAAEDSELRSKWVSNIQLALNPTPTSDPPV